MLSPVELPFFYDFLGECKKAGHNIIIFGDIWPQEWNFTWFRHMSYSQVIHVRWPFLGVFDLVTSINAKRSMQRLAIVAAWDIVVCFMVYKRRCPHNVMTTARPLRLITLVVHCHNENVHSSISPCSCHVHFCLPLSRKEITLDLGTRVYSLG